MVSCLSRIGTEEDDSSLADAGATWSKRLNEGMHILSDLALLVLPYVAPITASVDSQNIDYITRTKSSSGLVEGDLSHSKVYKGPLSYMEGSPLTLRSHFIQPYRVLDTLFSEYY